MATISGQHVVNRGVGFSSTNDPGRTVTPNEGLVVVRSLLRVLYNRATRNNPFFSAKYDDVDPEDGKWNRPAGALRVFLVEAIDRDLVDDEPVLVHNVSVRDRFKVADPPRIYRLGLCYYSVGEEDDPDNQSETLRFYYSDDSPGIASLESCLPLWFPDEHEELIVVQFAKYLALKDKARGDIAELKELEVALLGEFDELTKQADMNVEGRFGRHAGEGLKPQGFA